MTIESQWLFRESQRHVEILPKQPYCQIHFYIYSYKAALLKIEGEGRGGVLAQIQDHFLPKYHPGLSFLSPFLSCWGHVLVFDKVTCRMMKLQDAGKAALISSDK